jgi:hypothetical protein
MWDPPSNKGIGSYPLAAAIAHIKLSGNFDKR